MARDELQTAVTGNQSKPLRFLLMGAFWLATTYLASHVPTGIAAEINHKPYRLESVELRGTRRLDSEKLQKTLHIKIDDELSDEYVSELRARMLSLGIFKDALFSLQRGTVPGKTKLVISATDDDSVMGREALGGEFGLHVSEPERTTAGDNTPFRAYRFGLIARNLFNSMHRAALTADMDAKGTVTSGNAAYGLPRFAAEGVQFDSEIKASDPTSRYLETQAFGMKIQSLWSRSQRWWDLQYGAAWYSNTHTRYRLEGWPEVSAGPKIGLIHETRFLGFIPGDGWRASVSVLPSLVKREEAISEWNLAGTWSPFRYTIWTIDIQATTVGRTGVSTRDELRLDVPITDSTAEGTKALVFVKLRDGHDRYKDYQLFGSDAAIGIRYHSSGFIGELSFQITQKNPLDTQPPPVTKKQAEEL